MAAQPSTQLQASGHRYVLRRLERALLHGNVRPMHQPPRVRSSLAFGALVAAATLAGCAVLAMLPTAPPPTAEPPVPLLIDRAGHR